MIKKLFALASVTACAGLISAASAAGCTSTEIVEVPADAAGGSTDARRPSTGTGRPVTGDEQPEDTTCLAKDPIDATKYPYLKSAAPKKGACKPAEATALDAYYKEQGSKVAISDWIAGAQLSETCAKCIFTDISDGKTPTTWSPLLAKDDKLGETNRGGCIEIVSGSFDCGRAYQQYSKCLVDACTKDCKTQAEYQACRTDPDVLTVICKDVSDAVITACGPKTELSKFEAACKNAAYAWQGPVKILCVTGPATVPDAGADAGADADAAPPP